MPETRKRTKIRRSRQEIRKILRAYHAAGKTQREFCESVGIHTSVLGRWLRLERRKQTDKPVKESPALVPVKVKSTPADCPPTAVSQPKIEIKLTSGLVIAVSPGFDSIALNEVLSVLEARC